MPVTTATNAHTEQGTNCAQAVLRGFQRTLDLPEARITGAGTNGGGRAPNGICGGLHSALELVEDAAGKDAIRAEFERQAGAVGCHEVRELGKLSCPDCVRVAAELVQEQLATR